MALQQPYRDALVLRGQNDLFVDDKFGTEPFEVNLCCRILRS